MQFPAIAELVQRLSSDVDFQGRFSRNASETVASLNLSPAESRSLLRLQTRLAVPSGVLQYESEPLTGWP